MASKLPTVAIVGQANVGKSSLFNRMVRAQQAIVAREAGTTRDNVLGRVEYRHHQFWLVDTAHNRTALALVLTGNNDDFVALANLFHHPLLTELPEPGTRSS